MTTVDMSHPRVQAYIKALKAWDQVDLPTVQRVKQPEYAAVVEAEMKLTRVEVRAVHEHLAELGQ